MEFVQVKSKSEQKKLCFSLSFSSGQKSSEFSVLLDYSEGSLIRYINSDLFKSGCRYVNSIEDLPEISFEEIKQLINREEHFRNLSAD